MATDKDAIDFDRYIDAAAEAVRLLLPDSYRADALTYLRMAEEIARPLLLFDLDQSIEPEARPAPPRAASETGRP